MKVTLRIILILSCMSLLNAMDALALAAAEQGYSAVQEHAPLVRGLMRQPFSINMGETLEPLEEWEAIFRSRRSLWSRIKRKLMCACGREQP